MNKILQLIEYCGDLKQNEHLLIIYDDSTANILELFISEAKKITEFVKTCKINISSIHAQEPSSDIAREMLSANIIMCLTKSSLAHTDARKRATDNGSRFLSMPGYSEELLHNEAILFPYKNTYSEIKKICQKLTAGKRMTVISEIGTEIKMDIKNRTGNYCPGFVNDEIKLGSPPDAEANIAPIEENSHGIIVVDGSITHPEICKLKSPVTITVRDGKIIKFESQHTEYVQKLGKIFGDINLPNAFILAECGIGFNKKAALCGNMLVDEGTYGCVHFGFGSNDTIGGKNNINFHLDFVITKPTLLVDKEILIESGEILL